MVFTRSYVANSISGSSRACLLTGKHSHKNGFTDNTRTFDDSQQAFPKLLQQAGYQTAVIGKVEKGKHWRKSLYYHFYEYPGEHAVHRHYGVRTDRYKLIHFYGHDIDSWELYDLRKDPAEMHNLYGETKYRRIQKKLH